MADLGLGTVVFIALKPIVKIYLILGTGYLLARVKILSVEGSRIISDTVLNVLLPCLIFNKVVSNLQGRDIKSVGIICLSSIIIFATGGLMGLLTRICTPAPKRWFGGLLAAGIFPNVSDIPIAYLQSMDNGLIFDEPDGEKGVALVVIFLTMFTLCLYNLGGFRLMEWDFKKDEKQKAKDLVEDPEKSLDIHEEELLPPKEPVRVEVKLPLNFESSYGSPNLHAVIAIGNQAWPNLPPPDGDDDSLIPPNYEDNSDPVAYTGLFTNKISTAETRVSPKSGDRDNLVNERTFDLIQQQQRSKAPSVISSAKATSPLRHSLSIKSVGMRRGSVSRVMELRHQRPQDVEDLVKEYSHDSNDVIINESKTTDLGPEGAVEEDEPGTELSTTLAYGTNEKPLSPVDDTFTRILTTDVALTSEDIIGKRHNRFVSFLLFCLNNFVRPSAVATFVSLIIAFIPWLKSLFVLNDGVQMPLAPDKLPILHFVMDFTNYIGAASVPFALITLGACISRLKIKSAPKGFWKTASMLVALRLFVLPIIGVMWTNQLISLGWIAKENKLFQFVLIMSFSLPSMTTQIFFTAYYTDLDATDRLQMNCVSFYLLLQYSCLAVSLPFVVTYILNVQIQG